MQSPPETSLIQKFELDQKRRGLSQNTINLRNRQLRSYVREVGPLEDATEDGIQEWLDARVKNDGNPIGDKTRSGYLTTLSAFFKFCLKKKHLRFNPVELIDRPKVHNGMPNPIPEHDLARAIKNCTNPMLKCWIVMEAYGGLRCQEVAYLAHEDIRHDLRKVHIRFGKGGKERMVTLHKKIIEALAEYDAPKPTGRLWPNATPSTVSQRINRYYHGMGIQHTAHKNRHRYGTQLYKASGEDLLTVQKALGHSDPKTSAIYAGVDDESMDTAVDLIA